MRTLFTKPSFLLLLGVMSLVSSLPAVGQQFQHLPDGPYPRKVKKKSDKIDFFYDISRYAHAGASVADSVTTTQLLDHPTAAYSAQGQFLTYYYTREVGWASCLSQRNAFVVTTANEVLDTGVDVFARRLDKRGGRWRFAAIALLAGKTAISATAAGHNVLFGEGINRQVDLATGYKGLIVWKSH